MLRGFTDSAGREWRVWDVFPTRGGSTDPTAAALSHSSLKETAYAEGWLCFESGDQKRRLAPIPIGWQHCDLKVLEELCRNATPVRMRAHGQLVPGAA
jgi:hypothetical protein